MRLNINSNTAPFVSITWHQRNYCCVVYSHCPTNDSYNKCIHRCCLPCNYSTKPFGIMQSVIKNQRVNLFYIHMGNVPTLQTAHGNFFILCQMVLLPNINFIISKQTKTLKVGPKNVEAGGWYCYSIPAFFRAHQSNINKFVNKKNTSTVMNCSYSLPCSCYMMYWTMIHLTNDIRNKF